MSKMNIILFKFLLIAFCGIIQAKKEIGKKSIITCENNQHCVLFMTNPKSVCKNNTCVCEDEELCNSNKTDLRVKSNVIGEECTKDENCNIQFSVCSEFFCVCAPNKVASSDGRKCLEVSGGLGEKCNEDIQCIRNITGSVCRHSKCVCDDDHHQDKNSAECFNKVVLGQPCTHQSQCNHISRAYCGTLFCECESDFVQSTSKNKCLPIATVISDKCEETEQCRQLYGKGAVCMYGRCECDSIHRLANTTNCPSRLKQFCVDDNDCKSYIDDPTMFCDHSRCECQHPFVEEGDYCNGCGDKKSTLISLITTIYFIKLYWYYK